MGNGCFDSKERLLFYLITQDAVMKFPEHQRIGFWSIIIAIYFLSWFVQSSLLLNSDVSWLMLAAKRMLSGGIYKDNFFEINPPMILYLYTPAVLLKKILQINTDLAIKIYFFTVASVSFLMCLFLAKKIFNEKDTLISAVFLISITVLFLFFPLFEFGQREHFLIILTLP